MNEIRFVDTTLRRHWEREMCLGCIALRRTGLD